MKPWLVALGLVVGWLTGCSSGFDGGYHTAFAARPVLRDGRVVSSVRVADAEGVAWIRVQLLDASAAVLAEQTIYDSLGVMRTDITREMDLPYVDGALTVKVLTADLMEFGGGTADDRFPTRTFAIEGLPR
jgi:hypothetical protein